MRQREGGAGEDARIILRHLERLPGKIDRLATICFRHFGPPLGNEVPVAYRCSGKRRPVTRIDRDRLFEQSQSPYNLLFRDWIERRKRTQIEIVGGEIGRRPCGGAAHLGACNAGSITPATLTTMLS
jgi:hypothetical protein